MKRKRLYQVFAVLLVLVCLCIVGISQGGGIIDIIDPHTPLDSGMELVSQTERDVRVIPDVYNTGTKGNLTVVNMAETINGIKFIAGNNNTFNCLDFGYRNKNISGEVVFENLDFSGSTVAMYNEDKVDRTIKVIFKNCKFAKFQSGKATYPISYEFINCEFETFYGANATLKECSFSGGYSDGLVPFHDVIVTDSYVYNKACEDVNGKGKHTDGTQMYGYEGIDVTNVHFDNCRFEVPAINLGENYASVNACLMLQIEYSNGRDISFTNCVINGGGYSIFARSTKDAYSLSDVLFENIQIGSSHRYGALYPDVDNTVTFRGISGTNSLYVASVWKDTDGTHLSVSNDTNVERTLVVKTADAVYSYLIPACPHVDDERVFANYPFDKEIVLPEDAEYVVCYDATLGDNISQIRFVNWSGSNVYLPKKYSESLAEYSNVQAGDIISSGTCGKNVTYVLDSSGLLTISGTGATDSYHSAKIVPWEEYKSYIRNIRVEEGVTALGNQIFRKCIGIDNIVLPEGLVKIGGRAFDGCSFLASVTLPSTLTEIDLYAFNNVIVQDVKFYGSEELWSGVVVKDGNASISDTVKCVEEIPEEVEENIKASEKEYSDEEIISRGTCGKQCNYILLTTGDLILYGEGTTDNYHSLKNAPWFEHRDHIKKVIVEEGITCLGNQLFRDCTSLESAEIPVGVAKIGGNVFMRCSSMTSVTLPGSLREVGNYAFAKTALVEVDYDGTIETWSSISIGKSNEKLVTAYELSR